MIYVMIKNEKKKNEIKNLIIKKNIKTNKVVYSMYPTEKRIKQNDIIICDTLDEKTKNISSKAKIFMYKPSKPNKKNLDQDNNINIEVCKNIKDLEEKIDSMTRKNIYCKNVKMSVFKLVLLLAVIISIVIIYLFNDNNQEEKIEEKEIDFKRENIVLYGDSITDFYDVKHYFGELPIVNSGISGNGVDNLYDEIRERIYVYNPTKVFILIGTNDLSRRDDKYIYNKIKDIIELININRPAAKIYLESVYPVNKNTDNDKVLSWMVGDRTNERIKGLNEKLSTLCLNENVECEYINLYDELKDENGNLKLDYTNDGLHLSDEGYKVVTKRLMSYINPKLNKKVEKK